MRQAATALSASGWVESRPSRWRKASGSSWPRAAAKWDEARWVSSCSDSWSSACRVSESEEQNSRSRPRCTSSLSRHTSSSAISASGEIVLRRRSESDRADSNLTFCHSSCRAAWSAGIGPRCSERTRRSPSRMSRWLTVTSTGSPVSRSAGEPTRAEAITSRSSASPSSGWMLSPERASRPRNSCTQRDRTITGRIRRSLASCRHAYQPFESATSVPPDELTIDGIVSYTKLRQYAPLMPL